MVLIVLFWILLILAIIGELAPLPAPWGRVPRVIILLLIALLGWHVFGNPGR